MQFGGAICSLCGSEGTNKSTCPMNLDIDIKKVNAAKHPKADIAGSADYFQSPAAKKGSKGSKGSKKVGKKPSREKSPSQHVQSHDPFFKLSGAISLVEYVRMMARNEPSLQTVEMQEYFIRSTHDFMNTLFSRAQIVESRVNVANISGTTIRLLYRLTYDISAIDHMPLGHELVYVDVPADYEARDPATGARLIESIEENPKNFINYADVLEDARIF